jgi:hypothetical protein
MIFPTEFRIEGVQHNNYISSMFCCVLRLFVTAWYSFSLRRLPGRHL